ncbi:hypothetical protein BKA65DRAFT_600640 [Rhexocercosporidium sp. MPI-PUGE-AT-0058]|nr:hypothetical protein BKA65DRAFT_600640 [Rhexocercosporidium sp. MPI-PUGE-AT-0058]
MKFNNWAEERFDSQGILRFSNDGRPLERAVREPIKNMNWQLIRRMKTAPITPIARSLPEVERARFLAREETILDIQEERKTLAIYISEIKETRNWHGTQAHFPNLIVESQDMEEGNISTTTTEPLKWISKQGHAGEQPSSGSFSQNLSVHTTFSASFTTTITTTGSYRSPPSEANGTSSALGSEPPSKDDAGSSTPHPRRSGTAVRHQSQGFRPSFALTHDRPPTNPEVARLAHDTGVDIEPNYEGEVSEFLIRDRACPQYLSTAVYIKWVDPAWTSEDIFNIVREGGVYKYSRQEPNRDYDTCAVTLTFKHQGAAARFLSRARNEGVYIRGQKVEVVPSVHPCWGIEEGKEHQSRVLKVEGPEELLDADDLEAKFHRNIRFTLVKKEEWTEGGYKTIHFHFESILAQSRAAALYLHKENKIPGLRWQFVQDPCAIDGN